MSNLPILPLILSNHNSNVRRILNNSNTKNKNHTKSNRNSQKYEEQYISKGVSAEDKFVTYVKVIKRQHYKKDDGSRFPLERILRKLDELYSNFGADFRLRNLMHKMVENIIKEYAEDCIIQCSKDVMFHCYEDKIDFSKNYDKVIESLIPLLFNEEDVDSRYDIYYVKGHYKNNLEKKGCCIDWWNVSASSESCRCDFVNSHSWLRLIEKTTGKEYIVDLTGYKFHKDFQDIELHLANSNFENKEELYKYIRDYNDFIISENSENHKNYIPNIEIKSAKNI